MCTGILSMPVHVSSFHLAARPLAKHAKLYNFVNDSREISYIYYMLHYLYFMILLLL